MVCDICGIKNPEINIQQVIGNKKRNIHICRKCANDQGIIKNNDTLEFSLSKLVNFYLEIDKKKNNLICESCGTSLQQVRKNKKIGCEDCALLFSKYISRVLGIKISRTRQNESVYKGNIPGRMKIVKNLFIDLEILKKQLEKAVAEEDYEKAAKIRDRINNISLGSTQ